MGLTIIDEKFNKSIKELKAGDLFVVEKDEYNIYQGIFMKIKKIKNEDRYNAVKLNSGELYKIDENMILLSIQAELKLI